jgi:ATP-dependent DNA helicase RecG
MFLRELDAPVTHVKGAGPSVARILAGLGVVNVGSLLSYYPRDWEDRSVPRPIGDFHRGGEVNTVATVIAQDWFGFGRMKTLKLHVEDESSRAVLVCFNRPFLEKQAPVGSRFRLWGKFIRKYGEIQSTAFELEPIKEDAASGFAGILPIYSLCAGLSQGVLRRVMQRALADYAARIEDELPRLLRERYGFPNKAKALASIHFPATLQDLDAAKRALVYEELFYLEILVGKRALERRTNRRSAPGSGAETADGLTPRQRLLLERLPFELTAGQKTAIADINRDMAGDFPMARLLQGDVGSGKTLVAFFACLRAADSGGQAAILAPTELLARQHAENAARLLEPVGVNLAFLTGNVKAAGRSRLLDALADGRIDIVVGTHALFSKDVAYRDLRLAVVDEQHRFGVVQRGAITAKGNRPDLLMMSATPIPRTLALTVFGDLDASIIRDLPPGRKPVKTHLARQGNEQKVYDFVRKELAAGRSGIPGTGAWPNGCSRNSGSPWCIPVSRKRRNGKQWKLSGGRTSTSLWRPAWWKSAWTSRTRRSWSSNTRSASACPPFISCGAGWAAAQLRATASWSTQRIRRRTGRLGSR